jgi:hypothetical protein
VRDNGAPVMVCRLTKAFLNISDGLRAKNKQLAFKQPAVRCAKQTGGSRNRVWFSVHRLTRSADETNINSRTMKKTFI